jgi:2-methylcitrate dehydratase PrpD
LLVAIDIGGTFTDLMAFDRDAMSDRVATSCALARLSEIDDIHLASGITPGALIVPSALTIAASLGREGTALVEAVAVGYDAMVRLGVALSGPSILYRGIWPTYFAAPFGVAAVAARLLGLDEKQAANALAIALGFSSPAVGRPSGPGTSRWLAIGNAARNGVTAALSAQSGFSGDLRIFEGEFSSSIYGLSPDQAALSDDRPVLNDVSFKPWCAARQTMAATQALKEIIESGVAPSEMTDLVVSVPPRYLRMIDHGVDPGDRASRLTSVSYQMAVAALAPETMLDIKHAPDEIPEGIRTFMMNYALLVVFVPVVARLFEPGARAHVDVKSPETTRTTRVKVEGRTFRRKRDTGFDTRAIQDRPQVDRRGPRFRSAGARRNEQVKPT